MNEFPSIMTCLATEKCLILVKMEFFTKNEISKRWLPAMDHMPQPSQLKRPEKGILGQEMSKMPLIPQRNQSFQPQLLVSLIQLELLLSCLTRRWMPFKIQIRLFVAMGIFSS